MDALLYQKELLDIQRALQSQKQSFINAKIELGALMGLLPNEKFVLRESWVWKKTLALSTWKETANKSTKLKGGILPENKVNWTNEHKFSESFSLPKCNFEFEEKDGKDW